MWFRSLVCKNYNPTKFIFIPRYSKSSFTSKMLPLQTDICTNITSETKGEASPGSISRNKYLITASEAANIFGWGYQTRGQYHDTLVRKLKGEQIVDENVHPIVLEKMQLGRQMEPLAIDIFSEWTGRKVTSCKTFPHPDISWLAATPDALVDDDGVLEVKFRTNEMPPYTQEDKEWVKFYIQIQVQLQCTRRIVGYYLGLSLVCPCVLHTVYRDDFFWKTKMLPLMEDFLDRARAGEKPRKGKRRIPIPIITKKPSNLNM